MLILRFIAKFLKILNSAASPAQIAGGFILGMIIGLTPLSGLHNLLILFLIIILNVNITMAIFSFGVFSLIAYLMDPLFHNLGYYLLVDVEGLHSFWIMLYNIPIFALSRFNNTVLLGSFLSSLILLIPVYFIVKKAVVEYREKLGPKVQKWKIVKIMKSTKLYTVYTKVSAWRQ